MADQQLDSMAKLAGLGAESIDDGSEITEVAR
jgi:hypothetical protein